MKNIGVFFGSRSPEHDISIITGELVIAGLKKLNYPVIPVYIDKQGRWLIGDELGELKVFTTEKIDPTKFSEYVLDLEQSNGKLVFRKKGLTGKTLIVDIAFPALHGSNGEDGTIQGLFEIFNIPYVGCDVASSAVTMNKILTKLMLKASGIPTPEFVNFSKNDWNQNQEKIVKQIETNLGYPLIVKPPLLGSSIGIAKAHNSKELIQAIEVALHYGNDVLVEDCVENLMDITCCILGNDQPVTSLLQESEFSEQIFSYADKYLNDGGAQLGKATKNLIIPARISEQTTKDIQATAVRAFQALGCSGISRVDFLYNKNSQKFFVSEINTMPGTVYHHLWAKSGIELDEVLKRLIQLSEEKYQEKNRYTTVFESDLLRMAGSSKLQNQKESK